MNTELGLWIQTTITDMRLDWVRVAKGQGAVQINKKGHASKQIMDF